MINVLIRPAILTEEGDKNFIISSWLKEYRDDSKFLRRVRPWVYYEEHHKRIHKALEQGSTLIAYRSEEPEVILGYVNYDKILHWIYVRPEFRKEGVATQLLKDFDLTSCHFTHWTLSCDTLISRLLEKHPKMNYVPYAF